MSTPPLDQVSCDKVSVCGFSKDLELKTNWSPRLITLPKVLVFRSLIFRPLLLPHPVLPNGGTLPRTLFPSSGDKMSHGSGYDPRSRLDLPSSGRRRPQVFRRYNVGTLNYPRPSTNLREERRISATGESGQFTLVVNFFSGSSGTTKRGRWSLSRVNLRKPPTKLEWSGREDRRKRFKTQYEGQSQRSLNFPVKQVGGIKRLLFWFRVSLPH